jgi:hypothetical protein
LWQLYLEEEVESFDDISEQIQEDERIADASDSLLLEDLYNLR